MGIRKWRRQVRAELHLKVQYRRFKLPRISIKNDVAQGNYHAHTVGRRCTRFAHAGFDVRCLELDFHQSELYILARSSSSKLRL